MPHDPTSTLPLSLPTHVTHRFTNPANLTDTSPPPTPTPGTLEVKDSQLQSANGQLAELKSRLNGLESELKREQGLREEAREMVAKLKAKNEHLVESGNKRMEDLREEKSEHVSFQKGQVREGEGGGEE